MHGTITIAPEASDSEVEYGLTTTYGFTAADGALVTTHSQTLGPLLPGTVYHYRVKSRDAAGNEATSPNLSLKTPLAPIMSAPY